MITELVFCPPPTDRERSIQGMAEFLQLSPPKSLQHLHLKGFKFQDEGFGLILQHLVHNESITTVTFERCSFSQFSTLQFKNLFQYNPRIQTLAFSSNIRFTGSKNAEDTAAILGDFVQRNTTVKEIDISALFSAQFSCVITALEGRNLPLERLKCGYLDNHRCSVLAKSLPNFVAVKELSINVQGTCQCSKKQLLQAFMHNSSLTSVIIHQTPSATPFFSAADLKKVNFYTMRNTHVPVMLMESTETVPLYLRPTLFVAGQNSSRGLTDIFHDLVRLGDQVGAANYSSY